MFPKRLVIIIVMMMMKCIVILVFIGTTGIVTKGLIECLKAISGKHSVYSIQKTAVLGTLHIMRKYYSLEAGMVGEILGKKPYDKTRGGGGEGGGGAAAAASSSFSSSSFFSYKE
jgi:hypothetical protein